MLDRGILFRHIRAFKDDPWGSIKLYVQETGLPNGKVLVPKPLEYEELTEMIYMREPTLTISPESAQELMDSLWQCGFRPSEGTGSAGALAAVENHLADQKSLSERLFKILEHKLGVPK